jgi:hypothetical protein
LLFQQIPSVFHSMWHWLVFCCLFNPFSAGPYGSHGAEAFFRKFH